MSSILAPSRRAELARAFENAIRELRLRAHIEFAEAAGDTVTAERLREELDELTAPARRWRF
ncbi:MAG: hypothetical protein H7067_00680 [Burkholderiales bacterium]|nr:hypothetical protein [Opitutaceae bacterium]